MSLTRSWTPPGPYDLHGSLGVLCRGPYDPTYRAEGGAVWRGTRTPEGPAALCVRLRPGGAHGEVRAEAWGPGAGWVLEGLPRLLGAQDDPGAFVAHHDVTREAHRRHPGLRLIRTGRVLESLIPSVLEQKFTAEEAYRAWRLLVRRFGERAPGPHPNLWVMPHPRDWLRIPSWEWHRAGVDQKRSGAVVRALQRASRMEEAAHMGLAQAQARLQAIPGIGPWTAAEVLQRCNGEPDAVTVGDLHLPRLVGYALTGERGVDDDGMLALLAPYEGQRHRASRLVLLGGPRMPRRQPRFPVGNIAPL
ncbi:DNA-3-methyladenine glycosylase family protein [Streptomyces reniochalinae]|uniref:DNA-3-methyladenine glycosylase 2 family protein n=1 Tax=Streptomyces reniochalinae TaxID=2250578 RepID=A0A367EZ44_9ACTN|nr:DNA-3-methyladenine glycosylase [Streptomyces reniochalinae]RCG23343.1 DNA-3-methyladenine glycosylase 2 family protein [Streptomyces reniochalinae]